MRVTPRVRWLIVHLLHYDRDQWNELPGWRRSEVPVLIEYEYLVPGLASPGPHAELSPTHN